MMKPLAKEKEALQIPNTITTRPITWAPYAQVTKPCRKKIFYSESTKYDVCTDRGESGVEETLLDARPDGDGDDQDLVPVPHVPEGGDQELEPSELLLLAIPLVLPEPGQGVNKHGDNGGGGERAAEEDAGEDVDLGQVSLEVVHRLVISLVTGLRAWHKPGTEAGAAVSNVVIRDLNNGRVIASAT